MTKEQKSAEKLLEKWKKYAAENYYIGMCDRNYWEDYVRAGEEILATLKDRECDRCELLLKALESQTESRVVGESNYPEIPDNSTPCSKFGFSCEYALACEDEFVEPASIKSIENAASTNAIVWPTQKEIDDAYVENHGRADSCRSWRAGIEWLRQKMGG